MIIQLMITLMMMMMGILLSIYLSIQKEREGKNFHKLYLQVFPCTRERAGSIYVYVCVCLKVLRRKLGLFGV